MYIGTSGIDLMIKDVSVTKSKNPITSCRLATGQKAIAERIESLLSPKLGHSPYLSRKNAKDDGSEVHD